MTKPARRAFVPLISAVVVTMIAVPCAGLANTAGPYLTWQNKASTPVINTSEGPYPVPASPYGQVGDPYARALSWPTKRPEPEPASQPQAFVAVPTAPVRAPQVASISIPVPLSAPRPAAVVSVPSEPEDPGLADDPGMADDAPYIAPAPRPVTSHAEQMAVSKPIPAPKPVMAPPKPEPAPVPVVASVTASPPPVSPARSAAGYQVPATSKYATRIESARAAHAEPTPAVATATPAARPVVKKPGEKPNEKAAPPVVATAPEPGVSMAVRETDHVFIPGEQYTSAADEPRYYSLHRQYGLRPDPIPTTHEATGALLSGTIDTVEAGEEGGDPNDDTDKTGKDKNSASH